MSRFVGRLAMAAVCAMAGGCGSDGEVLLRGSVAPQDPDNNRAPSGRIRGDYEVWLVDQSNTDGLPYGGTIYVYDGRDVDRIRSRTPNPAEVIDLSDETAAMCLASTGSNPVRPHMILFNGAHTHAALAFVVSGHVVIFDAESREPLTCLLASPGVNGVRQAHAAFPSEDDTYILVANQNGKLLERIDTDYDNDSFVLNPAAQINLATCTTPNGLPCQDPVLRPDNAPICPIIDQTGDLGFVTLRGGGLFVVDPRATPMQILAEYDAANVAGNGCGGLDTSDTMYLNSGGGTASNLEQFDVYRFPLSGYAATNPPNVPPAVNLYTDDAEDRDAHGMVLVEDDEYLWVADRNANLFEVFETGSDTHLGSIDLSFTGVEDTAPDLMDISPDGDRVVTSTRGPNPLSGDPHASTGSDPGFLVLEPERDGFAEIKGFVPISNVDQYGVERADAHGIRIRDLTRADDDDSSSDHDSDDDSSSDHDSDDDSDRFDDHGSDDDSSGGWVWDRRR